MKLIIPLYFLLLAPAPAMGADLSLLIGQKININNEIIQFNNDIIVNENSGIESLIGFTDDNRALGNWTLHINTKDQCPQNPCYDMFRSQDFEDFFKEEHYTFNIINENIEGYYYIFTFHSINNFGSSEPIPVDGFVIKKKNSQLTACNNETTIDPIFSVLNSYYQYFMYGLNRGLNANFPQKLCVAREVAAEYNEEQGGLGYNIRLLRDDGEQEAVMTIIFKTLE